MPAPGLRDLQAGFWRALHTGDADAGLLAAVLPSVTLTPGDRVEIYRAMYFWRLHEVLKEDYPKTLAALGPEVFEEIVRGYVRRHPSREPSVRHLGRHLGDFLTGCEGIPPWAADLARLERARTDAFDAPDREPLRAADLCAVAPVDWPDLRFETVAALAVVASPWPVHEAWDDPERGDLTPRPTVIRAWRQDFAVYHAAMDPLEAPAFALLSTGAPFAAICEAVAGHVPVEDAPGEAASLVARWVEDGLIARLTP